MSGYLAFAGPASADVSIGRADTDGTAVDHLFIEQAGGGTAGDVEVADNHLYWLAADSIARANLDGSEVDRDFITGLGSPTGLTAGGGYLFWGGPTIGRARLDGTGVELSHMTPSGGARDVAANGQYLYWTSDIGIGRANLDGAGADPGFIDTGVKQSTQADRRAVYAPTQLALNSTRAFWVYQFGELGIPNYNALGRANLDGSGAAYPFYTSEVNPHPFRYGPLGADDARVFFRFSSWSPDFGSGADDISSVDADFASAPVTGWQSITDPFKFDTFTGGVAVDRGHVYWAHEAGSELQCRTDSEHGDQRQRGRKVRFEVWLEECERVTVRVSGRVKIAGERYGLKRKTATTGSAHSGDEAAFSVRPKGKHRREILVALKDGEAADARMRLQISDDSGNSRTDSYNVRLARR